MDYLEDTKAETVINKLRAHFGRYGRPDVVYSDNGKQFDCEAFRHFSRLWKFEHRTSSPTFSSSNGKVEEAIQTIKRLITKSKLAKTDPYFALLDFRNSPTQGVKTSPAQRLFNRRTKTLLPTTSNLLKQRHLMKKTKKGKE